MDAVYTDPVRINNRTPEKRSFSAKLAWFGWLACLSFLFLVRRNWRRWHHWWWHFFSSSSFLRHCPAFHIRRHSIATNLRSFIPELGMMLSYLTTQFRKKLRYTWCRSRGFKEKSSKFTLEAWHHLIHGCIERLLLLLAFREEILDTRIHPFKIRNRHFSMPTFRHQFWSGHLC